MTVKPPIKSGKYVSLVTPTKPMQILIKLRKKTTYT